MRKLGMITAIGVLLSCHSFADCQIVDGNKKTPYEGGSLNGIAIEKKTLATLNKQFPNLRVVENIFKGNLQTCVTCTEKHVTCSE